MFTLLKADSDLVTVSLAFDPDVNSALSIQLYKCKPFLCDFHKSLGTLGDISCLPTSYVFCSGILSRKLAQLCPP